MNINELRNNISSIDRRLLELIAERQRLVSEIGRSKQYTGRATRDFEREKDVLNMARQQAEFISIDPNIAEEIMRILIRSSLTSQERDRVIAERKGNGRRVLVIGGAGGMGAWFVDFFASQEFAISVADPSIESGPNRFSDWREAGIDYDIIVIATPLAVSGQILTELAEWRPKALIFDIASLKTPLRKGLEHLKDSGCLVASLHPMFGPETKLLSGRHLIFVDAGCAEATAAAKELFSATMVDKLEMDLDDHDRFIAYVLGLSHALNIAFFTVLANSGEAAPKLAQLSSTTFDAQLLVSTLVAHENPYLYFEIQSLNEFGLRSLDALCESVNKIRQLVADDDEEGFIELMNKGRDYLAMRC
jgi:chorismate mutase/prephenate dehydrogenase